MKRWSLINEKRANTLKLDAKRTPHEMRKKRFVIFIVIYGKRNGRLKKKKREDEICM